MDELRNDDIWAMHRKGATLKEIAAALGIKVEEARAAIIRKWRELPPEKPRIYEKRKED